MKAWLFGIAWVSVGAWLAWRASRPRSEQAMMVLFWPLFLGSSVPHAADPLARLRAALGEDTALLSELREALSSLTRRAARIDAELAGLLCEGEGEVAKARQRSRQLLIEARTKLRQQHQQALAAIEETATRLMLARESGDVSQIEAVLGELRSTMLAVEEVG
ncbi:MAG: DNA anti-recombination protein RmuC [Myxococcota bacterium]|jgi:DNA anti-recombination protein RmuC